MVKNQVTAYSRWNGSHNYSQCLNSELGRFYPKINRNKFSVVDRYHFDLDPDPLFPDPDPDQNDTDPQH